MLHFLGYSKSSAICLQIVIHLLKAQDWSIDRQTDTLTNQVLFFLSEKFCSDWSEESEHQVYAANGQKVLDRQ